MPPGALTPLQLSEVNLGAIAARGIPVPTYDRTRLAPRITHIGVGGFHRSHLAAYTDELAQNGSEWGIRGLGLLPADAAMAAALHPQDRLYSLIEKGPTVPTTRIVGSIVDYRHTAGRPEETVDLLADPSVAIVSMTVTEAGYAPDVAENSTFDLLARALHERRRAASPPVTILSCDNLSGNGDAARRVLIRAAEAVDADLAAWIGDHCSFPNSMVDRITPATSDEDRAALFEREGIVDRWPVVAEPFKQWVLEDTFVAGRPQWERVGALFTDDVHAWERYKLRILNAGHSCMAYLCALAGITFVDEAMAVPEVREYVEGLLAEEAVPALEPIPGHSPHEYAATVRDRFANPGVGDQIARLCIDGTAKFPAFVVPTIEHHIATGGPIHRATLALAGWARYLAVVPGDRQSPDASGERSRGLAHQALHDPIRFLELDTVFGDVLRDNERFRSEFVAAAGELAARGPIAAMGASSTDRRASPSG